MQDYLDLDDSPQRERKRISIERLRELRKQVVNGRLANPLAAAIELLSQVEADRAALFYIAHNSAEVCIRRRASEPLGLPAPDRADLRGPAFGTAGSPATVAEPARCGLSLWQMLTIAGLGFPLVFALGATVALIARAWS
jgi:hypothetical protein